MGRRKAHPPTSTAVSVFSEGVTESTQLCFHNKADCKVDINWINYDGKHQKYSTLNPQGSYSLSKSTAAETSSADTCYTFVLCFCAL